jgi:hypothetical protein
MDEQDQEFVIEIAGVSFRVRPGLPVEPDEEGKDG